MFQPWSDVISMGSDNSENCANKPPPTTAKLRLVAYQRGADTNKLGLADLARPVTTAETCNLAAVHFKLKPAHI